MCSIHTHVAQQISELFFTNDRKPSNHKEKSAHPAQRHARSGNGEGREKAQAEHLGVVPQGDGGSTQPRKAMSRNGSNPHQKSAAAKMSSAMGSGFLGCYGITSRLQDGEKKVTTFRSKEKPKVRGEIHRLADQMREEA
jgi:hypothetical protein